MQKFIKALKFISFYSFIGLIVGLIVGLYQLGMGFVVKGATYLIKSNLLILNIVFFVLVILLSFVNYFIIKFDKDIDGNGIVQLTKRLKNKEKVYKKAGIMTIILNSYVSSFCLMPLGAEAPSLVLASRIGDLGLQIFKIEDREETNQVCLGAGFGCAFLSPLAGLTYMLEHDKTINLKQLFKGFLVIGFSFLVTFFINKHHLLNFTTPNFDYNCEYIYILLIVGIISVLFAYLFNILTFYIKNLFNKYKDNFIVKYRGFLLFIISGILAFFFINFMGNGLNSIGFIYGVSSLVVVSLIFLFRFFMTLVYGLGKVSGGLVVPTLVIGGLIGYFICLLLSKIGLFDLYYVSLYVVVSMCLFFSLIFNMPYTGAMLFVSTILYSNCNILSIIPFTFFVFIIFVLFNKANKAIKNKGYYSYLLTINDTNC